MRFIGAAAVAGGLLLAPLASAATFGRPAEIPVGKEPDAVLVGDVNQDGTDDILTTSATGSTITVLPGTGEARFGRRLDYPGIEGARSAVLDDFDVDGWSDLAVSAGSTITIFTGSDGGLTRAESYAAQSPGALAAADLDGDGLLDLVAASTSGAVVSVLRGRGDDTFDPAVTFPIGSQAAAVAVDDLNGDEVPDIAAVGSSLSILFGLGDGTFDQFSSFASGPAARSIDAEDLNSDGDEDLVVAQGQNQVGVLINAGDGTFPDLAAYQVGGTPVRATFGDVDSDGNFDVVAVNRGTDDLSILSGRGDGTFAPQQRIKVGRTPTGLAMPDLNEDGLTDLVVSNRRSKSVTILLNGANAPQPTVCRVPRVARRTLAAAKASIRRSHCTPAPVRRRYSNRVKRGRVISQSPAPGARLEAGSRVALLVSRGPKRYRP